jgi:hypothetical protein
MQFKTPILGTFPKPTIAINVLSIQTLRGHDSSPVSFKVFRTTAAPPRHGQWRTILRERVSRYSRGRIAAIFKEEKIVLLREIEQRRARVARCK